MRIIFSVVECPASFVSSRRLPYHDATGPRARGAAFAHQPCTNVASPSRATSSCLMKLCVPSQMGPEAVRLQPAAPGERRWRGAGDRAEAAGAELTAQVLEPGPPGLEPVGAKRGLALVRAVAERLQQRAVRGGEGTARFAARHRCRTCFLLRPHVHLRRREAGDHASRPAGASRADEAPPTRSTACPPPAPRGTARRGPEPVWSSIPWSSSGR